MQFGHNALDLVLTDLNGVHVFDMVSDSTVKINAHICIT